MRFFKKENEKDVLYPFAQYKNNVNVNISIFIIFIVSPNYVKVLSKEMNLKRSSYIIIFEILKYIKNIVRISNHIRYKIMRESYHYTDY